MCFANSYFLDSDHKKWQEVTRHYNKTSESFLEFVYISVILNYVTAGNCLLNRLNL